LYELARKGLDVDRKPRLVHIFRLEVESFDLPRFTLMVECSSGTYIRSLVHDLGRAMGCGATLVNLTRTRYGPFLLEDAIPLSELTQDCFIYPPCSILDFERVVVDAEGEKVIRRGQCLMLEGKKGSYIQAYTEEGDLLAILSLDKEKNLWHPDKVFQACPSKCHTINIS
jgi:tRNA pseudouridine55 synthase